MKKRFSITLLAAAILSGCGSDSSKETPTEIPVNNSPEAFADAVLVQNNIVTTIDVLANDTDKDGDNLTISSIVNQPKSGTVEIINNQLVYTPENNVATLDTITYGISDGQLTAQAEVSITVNHTMTLAGMVTDSPISNALVSVSIGDDVFEVISDNEGNYILPLTINDMSALILIKAKGNPEAGQENVELITVVGDASSLLSALDEERNLTNEQSNLTNVTHVSTATYLLVKDRTDSGKIINKEEFDKLVGQINPQDLMDIAGFIKLLVDNPDYTIPEGETVLSVLDSESAEGEILTIKAIEKYLTINGLIDENGLRTEAFELALGEAIQQTISDPNVVEQFSVDNFSNQMMIDLNGAKQGWNEYSGAGRHYAADGTGTIYNIVNNSSNSTSKFTWAVEQGRLEINHQDNSDYISFIYIIYPFKQIVTDYGFSQSIADELVVAADMGLINTSFQIEMTTGKSKESYTLLSKTPSHYQVNVTGENFTQLTLPETLTTWSNPKPRITSDFSFNKILVHTPKSAFENKDLEDLEGNWALSLDTTIVDLRSLEAVTELTSDFVSLSGSSATARANGQQYVASLTGGKLSLTQDNVSYKFTPFASEGKGYLAQIEKWVNNQLEYVTARQIAQFDDSYALYTENLVTNLPQVHLSYINRSIEDMWDGDKLEFENIYGYLFNADGTLNRGIEPVLPQYDWENLGYGFGYFTLGDNSWTWDKSGRQVNLYNTTEWAKRHRTWEVISVDEEGRALVLEYSTWGWDKDGDGVIEDNEIGQFIRPRINIIKLDDLSRWEAEWQNTINIGLYASKTNVAVKQTMIDSFSTLSIEKSDAPLR